MEPLAVIRRAPIAMQALTPSLTPSPTPSLTLPRQARQPRSTPQAQAARGAATKLTLTALLIAAGVLLAACGKGDAPLAPAASASAAQAAQAAKALKAAADAPVLLVAPEDLRSLQPSNLASGPLITGSLQPEQRADLRSEIAAVVLQVLKDNGEPVKRGELLVRLDDTAIRDSLASAEEAARASQQAFEQMERQVQRQKTLQAQGMISMQALEDAEVRRNNAQSELVAARSRAVTARQQLRRTEVRAPFDGVASERQVSAGNTVQTGTALLKVIDPRTLRFEGLVSAERMSEIKTGQRVSFRVNGFPDGDFMGTVRQVDATANATTRQVAVLVAFADRNTSPRVAGLFAEGRIETGSEAVLTLPESALVRAGDAAHVWRVQGTTLSKVVVQLGERDARRGEYPVLGGLAAGDRILRNPGSTLVDGQKIELVPAAGSAAGSAGAAPGPAATTTR